MLLVLVGWISRVWFRLNDVTLVTDDMSSLVKENPLLVPLNKDKTVYDGFITVQVVVLR